MYPDNVAVVHGQRRYSYSELAERSWRLANALRSAGLAKGERVATLLFNSPAMLEAHFGVPAAGGVLVAVNNRLSSAEVGYILQHSGARYLLLDTALEAVTEPLDLAGVTVIRCDDTGVPPDPYEEFLAGASPATAGELAGARGGDDLDQLHLRDHGTAQGGAVHLPRRVPERAERGDRGRPGHRLGLPVDAADVPLQRLVLPVGGHRGRGAPRDHTRGGRRAHLGADRRRGDYALQRGPDRPADGRQPSPGAPPGAAGDGDGGRRPAFPDAAGPDERAQLPRRARVRPDRDLRADHRVPRAGRRGASSPRNSARGRWRARDRPTRRPIWSVSSTSR